MTKEQLAILKRVDDLVDEVVQLRAENANLKAELATFKSASDHVTENGKTRRSFSTGEGWAMVHAERLTNLEIVEEQLAEAKKDAERWDAISTLMFIGNLELTQEEDGGYSISVDPVENIIPFGWVGNSPEEAIDKAVAKIASLEEDEKLNTEY